MYTLFSKRRLIAGEERERGEVEREVNEWAIKREWFLVEEQQTVKTSSGVQMFHEESATQSKVKKGRAEIKWRSEGKVISLMMMVKIFEPGSSSHGTFVAPSTRTPPCDVPTPSI